MAHTGAPRNASRWTLRREAPSTVAILTGERHFAAMRRYRSFGFADHRAYLRDVHGLLRFLRGQGIHTRAARFDVRAFTAYCRAEHLDADSPHTRARYTAEVAAAGITLPYQGQPMGLLVGELQALQQPEFAAPDPADGRPRGAAGSPERLASVALARLFAALGVGHHHVVCSVHIPGAPLVAELHLDRPSSGAPRTGPGQLPALHGVLTAALATGSPGGLVSRTRATGTPARETVRGWAVEGGWLRPLSPGEVFAAYCTDSHTGDPVPPEPLVEYAAGLDLPRPGRGEW